MIKKILTTLQLTKDPVQRRAEIYRNVLREEAKIGGTLFGAVPAGVRREFFCLDQHTWVWHEEWVDTHKVRRVMTTRYDVRPQGIFKAQDGQPYQPLGRDETLRLLQAMDRYNEALDAHVMPLLQAA